MLFRRKSIVMVIKIGAPNHEDVKLTSGQLTNKDGEKYIIESRFTATAGDGAPGPDGVDRLADRLKFLS